MRFSEELILCVFVALSAEAVGAEMAQAASAGESTQAVAVGFNTVELIPTDRPVWRASNLFAPITGLFMGGPGYWYEERTIEVTTTPPGAMLEFSYVRENIQRRFERAEAPVLLVLPSRIQARRRDFVVVRALLDGHRQAERKVILRSREAKLEIELAPLPNVLYAVVHTYFSGRDRLEIQTSAAPTFRIQKLSDGFSIALLETSQSPEVAAIMKDVSSPNIELLRGEQLGEDLILRLRLDDAIADDLEMRSTQEWDPVRELHHLSIHLIRSGERASVENRARNVLAGIQRGDVFGCALDFDRSMRSQLDSEALTRALMSTSNFLDPYLRVALKRLGEISPKGVIEITDGSTFRPSVPIELSAAMTRSADAVGYIALLRDFVAGLESPRHQLNTFRGITAPELSRERFGIMVAIAERLERRCTDGQGSRKGL